MEDQKPLDPTLHDECPLCGQLPKAMIADADRWTWVHTDDRRCVARRGPKGWERI